MSATRTIEITGEMFDSLMIANLQEAREDVVRMGSGEDGYDSLLQAFDRLLDHYGANL